MGKVADLTQARFERMPHSKGPARCLHCGHEWVQVAPEGDYKGFKCPGCGLEKGVLTRLLEAAEGQMAWRCDCGCNISMIIVTNPEDSMQGVVVCCQCLEQHGFFEPHME